MLHRLHILRWQLYRIELLNKVPAASEPLRPVSCHKQGPLREGVLPCPRHLYAQYAYDARPCAPEETARPSTGQPRLAHLEHCKADLLQEDEGPAQGAAALRGLHLAVAHGSTAISDTSQLRCTSQATTGTPAKAAARLGTS